jgi:hypothetical protein
MVFLSIKPLLLNKQNHKNIMSKNQVVISNGTIKGDKLAADLGACFGEHWQKRDRWIASLRERGIKGAIFSCGWVNDKEMTVTFTQTSLIFNDGLMVGDTMVLGDWFSSCKLIRLCSDVSYSGNNGANTYKYKITNDSYEEKIS